MGALVRSLFPSHTEGKEWLYLVGLPDGRIKVGKTATPRKRLNHHRRTIGMSWCRVFPAGSPSVTTRAENMAIRKLSEVGQQVGRTEVFSDVEQSVAVGIVREACEESRRIPAYSAAPAIDETQRYYMLRAESAKAKHAAGLTGTHEQWQAFWLAHFRERRDVDLGPGACRARQAAGA